MKKVALICCPNEKKSGFNFVKDIDKESQLFKLSIDYAKKIADEVFVLTKTYGLIKEIDYTSSYDEEIIFRNEIENRLWSLAILEQLNNFTDIHKDEFVILADKNYYRNYAKFLKNVDTPIGNISTEEKINYLRKELNEDEKEKTSYGEKLHILFNSMKKYNYTN